MRRRQSVERAPAASGLLKGGHSNSRIGLQIKPVHDSNGSAPTEPSPKPVERRLRPPFVGDDWPDDCGATCYGAYPGMRCMTPAVLAAQYKLGSAPNGSAMGSMAVASFEGEFWNQNALDTFERECGLPRIQVTNAGPNEPEWCTSKKGIEMGLCFEAMLDIEMIKAVGGGVPLTVIYNDECTLYIPRPLGGPLTVCSLLAGPMLTQRWIETRLRRYSLEQWALQANEMGDEVMPIVHSISYGYVTRTLSYFLLLTSLPQLLTYVAHSILCGYVTRRRAHGGRSTARRSLSHVARRARRCAGSFVHVLPRVHHVCLSACMCACVRVRVCVCAWVCVCVGVRGCAWVCVGVLAQR
jgi:hypothetical protein